MCDGVNVELHHVVLFRADKLSATNELPVKRAAVAANHTCVYPSGNSHFTVPEMNSVFTTIGYIIKIGVVIGILNYRDRIVVNCYGYASNLFGKRFNTLVKNLTCPV